MAERELPLIARARAHGQAVALRTGDDASTYADLLERSALLAAALLAGKADLAEARVALLAEPGSDYIAAQWAIWRAGGVAVPLCLSAAESELQYTLSDAQCEAVLGTGGLMPPLEPVIARLGLRTIVIDEVDSHPHVQLPQVDPARRAMILYTSGTTSRPKGVVTTNQTIEAQITTLIDAWRWQAEDTIPLFLPLHHVHGIINVMCCALWSGATIEPFPRFDVQAVLERVAAGAYSVFMAVPTIYVKLIQALESLDPRARAEVIAGFAQMRLMVSGSAALPASVHERWTELTGQALLERYGMTEIGMALSNPYEGERRPGAVGQPLPGVEIRLKDERGNLVTDEGTPGEIQVRGPSVFREYWNQPQVTAESFDEGWFRTGDMAVVENGYYRIMGRLSVDIIKSGGYKLSALEIEAVLLDHPAIRECAVIGLADDTWGEAVSVAAVLHEGQSLDLAQLRLWCRDRMSDYKIPKNFLAVDNLPRNAMGKVTKPDLHEWF